MQDISQKLAEKLNTSANEDMVWFALDQIGKENLSVNSNNLPNHFARMSQREVIKKVGFSSIIALQIVTSMISPTAVYAASLMACTPAAVCPCQNNASSRPVGGVCPTGGSGSACSPASTSCGCYYASAGTMIGICQTLQASADTR